MKKNIIKTEEIYIIRHPKKSFLAVIGLDTLPPGEKIHEGIEEIKKAGFDIFFILRENELKEKKINPSKFTALSEGIGFLVINSTNEFALAFLDVYRYIVNTIPGYVGVTWAGENELWEAKPKEIETAGVTWITLGTSGSLPALEIEKRPREKLYESAFDNEILVDEKKSMFGDNYEEWAWEMLGNGSWEIYTSKTLLPYLPHHFFSVLSEAINLASEDIEDAALVQDDWVQTWRECDKPLNLISSAIKQFSLQFLDRSPGKVELNPEKEIVKEKKVKIKKPTNEKKTPQ